MRPIILITTSTLIHIDFGHLNNHKINRRKHYGKELIHQVPLLHKCVVDSHGLKMNNFQFEKKILSLDLT